MSEVPWSAPVVTSPALIAPPDFYAAGFQALGSSCRLSYRADSAAIATSGDYARNFSLAGQRYGHIIAPRSGYPVANRCLAVSVIAPRCTEAGVLSTAAFILGAEAGLPFLESHPQAEGCIVSETGRRQTSNFHKFSL